MSFITSYTRGHASAQGRSKIWFCAHPEDVEQYLKPISETIYDINSYDWAVWYDAEPLENYDETFLKSLDRMELFVIPVTEKLLCEKNRAIDVEIPFAMKHHIPILPLMQERGLVDRFNERLKNIQYLDTEDAEYTKKLKDYLFSVFIEGELINQVKRNFAKRIFLSYRKKDKLFVSEIMSEIHKMEHFRGIAIWFDDFLNPGENFDGQILNEIDQCDAVLLLVTPNILENNNYVLTCEYKEAYDRDKFILPVEGIQTDEGEYFQKYPTLSKPIPLSRMEDIWSTLESLWGNVERVEVTPERAYLYGLAYLNGIDVEKNYEYAVSFLKKAAQGEYTPAMEKLSDMYAGGHGVAFHYASALLWKKKATECYAKTYETLKNEESAVQYIESLHDYAALLVDACMSQEAYESHVFRCKVCEEVCNRFPQSFWFKRDLFEAYMSVAREHIANEELTLASEYLKKGQALGEFLEANEGGEFNAYNMATLYASLAEIYEKKNEKILSKENYHKAIRCAQKIVMDSLPRINDPTLEEKNEAILPRNMETPIIHLITTCWMSLGDIALSENNPDEAKYYYHDAERSLLGHSLGSASFLLTESLLRLFGKLLELYSAEENYHQSMGYCEQGESICRTAKEDSWYPPLLKNGIALLDRAEKIYEKYGHHEKMMAVRGLMIDLLEALVIKTCDENYLNMYCNACGRYAADNSQDGKESVSVAYCNKALEMLEKFGSLLPPSLLIEFLYRFYSDQSKYLAACGDVQEAIVYAEKSLEICDRGMVEHAEDRSIHICSQLFDLCCELGKREMALEYLQKACEICNEVLAHSDSLDMKRTFSILLEKLAAYCMENQNFEIAKQCMTQSASLTHEIFQAQKDTQSYDDMLHACLCMMQMFDDDSGAVAIWQHLFLLTMQMYVSEFLTLPDSNAEMLEAATEKMMCAEPSVAESSSRDAMLEILKIYGQLNGLGMKIDSDTVMEMSYERIADIGNELLQCAEMAEKSFEIHRILCHTNQRMGDQWVRVGQNDRATACYLSSRAYAKSCLEQSPSNESLHTLADICQKLGGIYSETATDQAVECYLEAIRLYKQMIAAYGEIYEKHNYAVTGIELGKLYVSNGDPESALAVYEEVIAFLEKDADMHRIYPRIFAIVLEKTGDIYIEKNKDQTMIYYKKAMDIFEKAYNESADDQTIHDLAIIVERVARCCVLRGDMMEAEQHYLHLEKIQKLIYTEHPGLRNSQKLKETTEILSTIYEERGDVNLSIMYVEKLIKICETILGHGPTEQAWFEYGVSLYRVARLRRDGLWFRQALRIFESLSKNPEKREFYAEIIRNIHEQLSAL